jgi:ornithine cyclodeaminase
LSTAPASSTRPRLTSLTKDALTELGHALTADQAGYSKRTVFKTVGIAIQDWAIARLLADKFLAGEPRSS